MPELIHPIQPKNARNFSRNASQLNIHVHPLVDAVAISNQILDLLHRPSLGYFGSFRLAVAALRGLIECLPIAKGEFSCFVNRLHSVLEFSQRREFGAAMFEIRQMRNRFEGLRAALI